MPNALQLPLSINFKRNYWTSFHLSLQLRLQLSLPANIAHVEVQTALNKSESKAKCVKYSDAHSSNTNTNNNKNNKQNKSRESECVCERQMQLCKAGGVARESKGRGSWHGNPQLLFSICCCFSCCCCTNKACTRQKVTWQSDARLPSFVVLQPVSVLCCLLIGATGGTVQQGLALLIRGKATREWRKNTAIWTRHKVKLTNKTNKLFDVVCECCVWAALVCVWGVWVHCVCVPVRVYLWRV